MVSKNGKTKEVLNTRSRAKKGSDISSITKKFSKEALGVFDAIKNPEIATELYKVLTVIQKDKEDGIDYHRIRNFAYHRVLLGHIHIDTQSFQNRRTPYSEYSVQGIVEAVKSGEFKWKMFTPALLWRSNDAKLYVLAGHSRNEAFTRLSTKYKDDAQVQAYCEKHNCNFEELPSLILNDIDFDDAKMVALMSNALATAETDIERANVYRQMRIMERDKKSIEEFGKKCEKSNRSRIRSFSYLAPNGVATDMLYAFETGADSNYIVKRISYRVGELRRKNSEISDTHENELFDRLLNKGVYGKNKNKGEINKMEIFIDIVENHIHKLKETNGFSPDALLNINSIKDISYVMKNYYETLNIYKAKKNVLMKDFHDLRRKISKLNATTDVSDENRALLKRLEEQFHTSFKTIANSEDLGTATNMLFDAVEINLNPDDQIAKCEAIKEAIIKEIQTIEQQYYKHINKKKAFLEAEKATPKLEF